MNEYHYEDGLESERLITKFVKDEDWTTWAKFYEDEGMGDFLPTYDETKPNPRAKKHIETQLERYETKSYGMQWLINKESGDYIGQGGLLFRVLNGKKEFEVAYAIYKQFGRQWYAREAVGLFQRYAFDKLLASSVIAMIDPKNVMSQSVAERNGMAKNEAVDWKGHKLNIWRLKRSNQQ